MKDNNCAKALERERERESAIRQQSTYAIPLSRSAISARKPLLCALIYQEHSLSRIRVWL